VFCLAIRNNIVLLRHAQSLAAAEPTAPKDALMLRGARDLTMPIVTSALVTFIVAGNVAGLEILRSLAAVIVGGLISSTLFTLFVLPAICANMNYSGEPDPLVE
jgi:Cu/Ag efflux pump CusA